MVATENNNHNKELYSRPAILEVILNEFGQKPLSFLELYGDGTGAEFYSTWANIYDMVLIERDSKKYNDANPRPLLKDKCKHYGLYNIDLSKYFKRYNSKDKPYVAFDVVNLDFCTYLWDNGKENCTAYAVEQMFESGAIKDGGLVFFGFMIKGWGANLAKWDIVKTRDEFLSIISKLAERHGYMIEEKLYYTYRSSTSTTMANLGIQVTRID